MAGNLTAILDRFRAESKSEREKGTYFENIVLAYFRHDPLQKELFDDAWTYEAWAESKGLDRRDTGIDLVAKIAGEDTYCAIQCKFFDPAYRIQKGDIDSFFTASGKSHFSRRIIVDSTDGNWSENAEEALRDQNPPAYRIGLSDLEESNIDWNRFVSDAQVEYAPAKELRDHQREALIKVREGLAEADRGKLIMACGTGKTFCALKIAEDLAGVGKTVLFMVPSLSLMSQTVREWTIDAGVPMRSFAVCSDVQVGKRRGREDTADIDIHDLAYPATTDPEKLAANVSIDAPDKMTVVFATYHSIDVLSKAQLWHKMKDFDLIICDEAHRTTGAIFLDEEESNFTKIHSNGNVGGAKRLYMTATPRVYGEGVKQKADEASVELCSMDNEDLYGKTLFARGFAWAVEKELLTDYKVIVLAVDEGMVADSVQRRMVEDSELKLDDATKIIGCYKALSKDNLQPDVLTDPAPMKRALAFCKDIKTSKLVTQQFASVVNAYLDEEEQQSGEEDPRLRCELNHVDGTFNAKSREHLLRWLKEDTEGACRILSNARCLSEGVDVPALDAILFLHPRKSQIDVVQSVGRVMRRAEGKKMGYVILPIAIPAGVAPEEALNDNERYKVVWQILNALRSHDERMDATINKIDLGEDVTGKIEIIAVTNKLPERRPAQAESAGLGGGGKGKDDEGGDSITKDVGPEQLSLWVDEFASAIMAKIVKKCGKRTYWEDWAGDIARIAEIHITRIKATIKPKGTPERAAFDGFLDELRDDLNPSISEDEAVEMLAQHIITKPVFDALFEGYSFAKNNPVSRALESVLGSIHAVSLEGEAETLEKFYASVKRRAAGVDTAEAKQKIIVQLYDSFFRNAFPKMTERLGIVYTPVEVVDFIIKSVDDIMRSEFGQTLGSNGVHIIDPFVGTGTFITRLLQSGLIGQEQLEHKYKNEIHANEIVLLAYYIAAINIEAVYHSVSEGSYAPFEGICLTDTFQLYEQDRDMIADLMPDNSERRTKQKALDIRVIIGNPPYSVGQGSANDDAANLQYPALDSKIRDTYATRTRMTNKRALYDSYIRAIRWGTDRIGDRGVMAFVTNAGWIDGNAMDGLRRYLVEDFSSLYVFHLRGNARTSGDRRRKEKDNVFGQGTRTPVAIAIFVKNPDASDYGKIRYHDVGDYLSREEKLGQIQSSNSLKSMEDKGAWSTIIPNDQADWINQGDSDFHRFLAVGSKQGQEPALFNVFSAGMKTNRDTWTYNSSPKGLAELVRESINYFNSLPNDAKPPSDDMHFKWCQKTIGDLQAGKVYTYNEDQLQLSQYRPFQKQWLYRDSRLNWSGYLTGTFFPNDQTSNRVICVSAPGARGAFSAILADSLPSIHFADVSGCQCLPLNTFSLPDSNSSTDLFSKQSILEFDLVDGISDVGLKHFKDAYPSEKLSKEDIFYYTYAILHSKEYLRLFADNLSKELPRIPCVKRPEDFWHFVKAGRTLGDLHVDYESAEAFPVTIQEGSLDLAVIDDPEAFYRVEKMKFGGKRPNQDKTTVHYNPRITMTGIPLEAYDYVVNGKPALEWVMERQAVTKDKASGIVNDANRYAIETMGDPAYPLKLFQRVITVSLETMKIVNGLPKLDLQEPHS
jgi:predicted helicase